MIKKQIEFVNQKFKQQVHAVFGGERRKKRACRDYLDSLFYKQEFTKDREVFMMTITLAHRSLCEIWRNSGKEAVWDIIRDGKAHKDDDK